MTRDDFHRLDSYQLSHDAAHYFNFELNVKKVKFTENNENRKFLGYTVEPGGYFVKDDLDLFKSVLYTERPVTTLEKSFTRLFALYL